MLDFVILHQTVRSRERGFATVSNGETQTVEGAALVGLAPETVAPLFEFAGYQWGTYSTPTYRLLSNGLDCPVSVMRRQPEVR